MLCEERKIYLATLGSLYIGGQKQHSYTYQKHCSQHSSHRILWHINKKHSKKQCTSSKRSYISSCFLHHKRASQKSLFYIVKYTIESWDTRYVSCLRLQCEAWKFSFFIDKASTHMDPTYIECNSLFRGRLRYGISRMYTRYVYKLTRSLSRFRCTTALSGRSIWQRE